MRSVVASTENIRIADALVQRARAETWHHRLRSAAYGCAGLGMLIICAAGASILYVNGRAWSEQWLAGMGASLSDRISQAISKATLHGSVQLAGGGKVGFDGPGRVTVQQDQPLRVTGEVGIAKGSQVTIAQDVRPTEGQLGRNSPQPPGVRIVTNFTVFKYVDLPPGQVVTGWNFDDSNQELPSSQYCYFAQTVAEGARATISLGKNGEFNPAPHVPKGLDAAAAFRRCIWRSS